MTPEELADRHPRLFHLTVPEAVPSILRHGLLPTDGVLTLWEATLTQRAEVERRRPRSVPLHHPAHGTATITDNAPLSDAALAKCLDDGLSPADWHATLRRRVFFWADEERLQGLAGARLNRGVRKAVLVFDTLSLVRAHTALVELCPINSGQTSRRPARRGLSTFTPLRRCGYGEWRRLRGGHDRIVEVTVAGAVTDPAAHLRETRIVRDGIVETVTTLEG